MQGSGHHMEIITINYTMFYMGDVQLTVVSETSYLSLVLDSTYSTMENASISYFVIRF